MIYPAITDGQNTVQHRHMATHVFTLIVRTSQLSSAPVVSIIEDDESVRVATTKLVRLHGFVTHGFASAEEFLASPRVNDTSCLITDINMPGMSGLDLQAHLIAQGNRLPIIFITAFPKESNRAKALEAGAVAFLTKPFDGQTLINRLREALSSTSDRQSDPRGPSKA